MIRELTVRNLAIIESAQLPLGPGLTVLTGETGAGKSLLVDAIELALGDRADSEIVRTGQKMAQVHVVFESDHLEAEDGRIFIQRDVLAEGRSQCRINGRQCAVSQLKTLGAQLVDLHGQHDHQSLLNPDNHLGFLDAWIGEPGQTLKNAVAHAYASCEAAARKLAALRSGLRDREHRLDLLRFQISEIEAVGLQPGETETLQTRLNRLKNAERLAESAHGALAAIADSDGAAHDRIGEAVRLLEDSVRFDPGLEALLVPIREAFYGLQEAAHGLRDYAERLESDPRELEDTAARLDAIARLKRKYGDDEQAILAYLEQSQSELALLDDAESTEAELADAYEQASKALIGSCTELTELRRARAIDFAAAVQSQLQELAMDRAVFGVDFAPKNPSADGADQVEFSFSANLGESARPLSKIASGGEISRVMLAIKTGLAGRAGVPTLIFDEVDAGLGGRAATTVGSKLRELARHNQVLVISHLPQIACYADVHFHIEKTERDGRVTTEIRRLEAEDRVREVARMIAGDHITDVSLANAREMLSHSQ